MRKLQLPLVAPVLMASLLFTSGAFALNYSGRQGNKATFETLEEARVSGPVAVAALEGNKGRAFKSHPVLDGYSQGTTYVYRSANLFGGRAARSNTNILVLVDKSFANKDAALTYLKDLGVINIIDAAIGSVVLVTPSDSKAGFTASDQKAYYALQTAMLSLKVSETVNSVRTTYADPEYFGGFGFLYVIGIDGGATFFNNYIANTFDYASRIAGVLLTNGKVDDISQVACVLPAYLVNAPEAVQTRYRAANETDAVKADANATTYFNQAQPLQQVIVSKGASPNTAAVIKKAYDEMFSRAMRIPVVRQGLHSAGTPYQGYSFESGSVLPERAECRDQRRDAERHFRGRARGRPLCRHQDEGGRVSADVVRIHSQGSPGRQGRGGERAVDPGAPRGRRRPAGVRRGGWLAGVGGPEALHHGGPGTSGS